jgi:hypothetical protein
MPNNFDEGENSAPTSTDDRAMRTRNREKAMDMVDRRYVDMNTVSGRRMNAPPTDRSVRIYSDGIFDLFHLGYVRVLGLKLMVDICDSWNRRRRRFPMYI